MIRISIREALAIQERQIVHYGPQYPGGEDALRRLLCSMTNVTGRDLDALLPVSDLKNIVPRGGAIEKLVTHALSEQALRSLTPGDRVTYRSDSGGLRRLPVVEIDPDAASVMVGLPGTHLVTVNAANFVCGGAA